MPRLIDDVVEVKPDDVKVLEPIELEWTKDKEGVYHHDHFCIVPSGGKFALEVTESKGKKARKATQACKGPLKVCKGFALDISEGRLVKTESGNWGAPPVPEVKPFKMPGHGRKLKLCPETTPEELAALGINPISEDDSAIINAACEAGAAAVEAVKAETIPEAVHVSSLVGAISILSREYPISALPPGSHFSQGGRFGTFIEMVGSDAKVEWDGKTTQWSGASPVKWAAERPIKTETKSPKQKAEPEIAVHKDGTISVNTSSTPATQKAPVTPKADKSIFGHHVKRVIMAMTVASFTAKEIASVVKAHHIDVAPARIATVMNYAKTGKEGDPAALTPDQLKQLKNVVGKK